MDLSCSIEEFFRTEVDRALKDKRLTCGPLTEHYLVQLLAAYGKQRIEGRPLALRMMDALESSPRERRIALRDIGDTSLYVSGFWADSLATKPVDVDYYIDMGGSAYSELARGGAGWTGDPFGGVFGDLAENFARFVEVLMLVSRRTARASSNQDVLRLYQRWQATKSEWVGKRLAALGVVPQKDGGRLQ
jgi:hypothetical protein